MEAGAFARLDDGTLTGRLDMGPKRSRGLGNHAVASDRPHYAFDAIALGYLQRKIEKQRVESSPSSLRGGKMSSGGLFD
ncbi:MAG: hypothetical protein AAF355_11365 [Myxococcota bacterium]